MNIFKTIFTPMIEIHIAKKDLKRFDTSIIPSSFVDNMFQLKKGIKLTLDLLHLESVSFIEYVKQFPEVNIREISRFKHLTGELEEE